MRPRTEKPRRSEHVNSGGVSATVQGVTVAFSNPTRGVWLPVRSLLRSLTPAEIPRAAECVEAGDTAPQGSRVWMCVLEHLLDVRWCRRPGRQVLIPPFADAHPVLGGALEPDVVSADCEDSIRSLIVLGCGLVTTSVTLRLTGFVPSSGLVRSWLPAPARYGVAALIRSLTAGR